MKHIILTILYLCLTSSIFAQIDTEFWFAAPEVTSLHDDSPILLRISSFDQPCQVSISQPANTGFTTITISLNANSNQSVDLTPWLDVIENKPFDQVLDYGLYISSTAPITAYYEVNAYYNPELFALKGKNALGTDFFISTQNLLYNDELLDAHSGFIIIATEDNTTIRINPAQDIYGHAADAEYIIVLNKGQTYAAVAAGYDAEDHLCGSTVKSDKPIAITMYDDSMNGTNVFGGCQDLGGDQLIPVNKIGNKYIAVRGFLTASYDKIFVLAVENSTIVYANGSLLGTINAGETVVYSIAFDNAAYVQATKPVYVLHMSGNNCETGLALLPHIECNGSQEITITRSDDSQFHVSLITMSGGEADFLFNGNAGIINATSFTAVPSTNGEWVYAQLPFDISTIPGGSAFTISNTSHKFHMGIIHGTSVGCRYGFFSDYAQLEFEVAANGNEFCEGETLSLSSNYLPDVTYDWSGPGGFTAHGQSIEIEHLGPNQSGFYVLKGTTGFCNIKPDSVYITVHPSPADLGHAVNPTIIPDGLKAFYPFNGNANDESGNRNNGIVHNAVLGTDRCGNPSSAYVFNGIDTYIEAPGFSADLPPVTVAAWAYYDSTITSYLTPQIMGVYFPQVHLMQLEIGRPSYHIFFNALPEIWHQTADYVFSPMNWHFVTGTYDGSTSYIYYDGIKVYESPCTGSYSFADKSIYIGRQSYDDTCYWNGKIDEVRIYDRAISADEVMSLYLEDCNRILLGASVTEKDICSGESSSIKVIHSQSGIRYQLLQDGNAYGNPQTGNQDTLIFPITGLLQSSSFQISATDPDYGCSIILDTIFTINVISLHAEAYAVPDSEYAPATVSLSSSSQGATWYEWLLDDVSIAGTATAEILLEEPGEYKFVLQAGSGPPANCNTTDTVLVTLEVTQNVILDIPNSFTPNGDGINDYFEIRTEGITNSDVWIKDRWGLLIAEFDGQAGRWDGTTTSGSEAPAAPYYFHVEAIDYAGKTLERSGVVYLIRDLVELSPNPVINQLKVKMNGRIPGDRTVRIVSTTGVIMAETIIREEEFDLDLSRLKQAIYLLQISNGLDYLSVRFIKQ